MVPDSEVGRDGTILAINTIDLIYNPDILRFRARILGDEVGGSAGPGYNTGFNIVLKEGEEGKATFSIGQADYFILYGEESIPRGDTYENIPWVILTWGDRDDDVKADYGIVGDELTTFESCQEPSTAKTVVIREPDFGEEVPIEIEEVPEGVNCTDSDGGKSYFTKGTTIDYSGYSATDYCLDNGQLKEHYCSAVDGTVDPAIIDCPSGYECPQRGIGKCVRETSGISIIRPVVDFFRVIGTTLGIIPVSQKCILNRGCDVNIEETVLIDAVGITYEIELIDISNNQILIKVNEKENPSFKTEETIDLGGRKTIKGITIEVLWLEENIATLIITK